VTTLAPAPTDTAWETNQVNVPRSPTATLLRSPIMVIGLLMVGTVVFLAVFAPQLTTHDPSEITGDAMEQPSSRHWLGTDEPGRDIFAQLVYGTRPALAVAVVGAGLALAGGVLLGVLPALVGGNTDLAFNRLVVFLLALPGLPLLILIGALAGPNDFALLLVIASSGAPPIARVLRSQAVTLRERGYIHAARGFGAGPMYVLRRHLAPALGPLMVVEFVNWAAVAVALQAALAFLGLGDPSSINWGLTMERALSQENIYFSPMWTWWVLPPGLAITFTVLGFTFVGIALEPAFNPRWLRSA
jgi:peptide/nickel transport system permease protein